MHLFISSYNRCFFELNLPDAGNNEKVVAVTPFTKVGDNNNYKHKIMIIIIITTLQWCDISPSLVSDDVPPCQPVVLNRVTSNAADNPFGSTFCYGHGQVIFEVGGKDYLIIQSSL